MKSFLLGIVSGLFFFGLLMLGFPWIIEYVSTHSSIFGDAWHWWADPFVRVMPEYQEPFGYLAAGFILVAGLLTGFAISLWATSRLTNKEKSE